MTEADTQIKQEATKLTEFMGDNKARVVLTAIDKTLTDLHQVIAPSRSLQKLDTKFDAKKVDDLRAALEAYAAADLPARALRLGRCFGQWHTDCTKLNRYFTEVARHMESATNGFDREMKQSGEQSAAEEAFQSVERRYGVVVDGLAATFALDVAQNHTDKEDV